MEIPLTGVGVVIISPEDSYNSLVTLLEGHSKRRTNKLQGMRSLPMESCEMGESYDQAIVRLFEEEVKSVSGSLGFRAQLCICELAPGVLVNFYLYEVDSRDSISLGSFVDEVSNVQWTQFSDILSEPLGGLRFRPGVYEGAVNCIKYLYDPGGFQPQKIDFGQLRCLIPSGLFDLLERGISQNEALSQLGLGTLSSLKPEVLIHL